jgi:hypothetical protein
METIPEIMDVALQLLESSGSSTRCYKHHTHNNEKYNNKKGLPAESKIQSAEKSLNCLGKGLLKWSNKKMGLFCHVWST